MSTRQPAVAGRFYPAEEDSCRRALNNCLPATLESTSAIAGLMPHAGWTYSGNVAAKTAVALAYETHVDTVVLFGAVHYWQGSHAAIFPIGRWMTPLGPIQVDHDLASAVIAGGGPLFEVNVRAHDDEHSIEVELPFFQRLAPDVKVLPIMVPPTPDSADVGAAVANACRGRGKDVIFVASSDLTHYGPSYGFTPYGTGNDAFDWAKNVNDVMLLDRLLALDADAIVPLASRHRNACGAGAIAATIAAARQLGATQATLLDHTTSAEISRRLFSESPADSVGYAAVTFS